MKEQNSKLFILPLDVYNNLTAWLETGDCIAQCLIEQGQTQDAKALAQRWRKREDIVSCDLNEPDFSHTLDVDNQQALYQLLPYQALLNEYLLAIPDNRQPFKMDEEASDRLPTPAWLNYQVCDHWQWLYGQLSPLFQELS